VDFLLAFNKDAARKPGTKPESRARRAASASISSSYSVNVSNISEAGLQRTIVLYCIPAALDLSGELPSELRYAAGVRVRQRRFLPTHRAVMNRLG
jgi:hypothetical protein